MKGSDVIIQWGSGEGITMMAHHNQDRENTVYFYSDNDVNECKFDARRGGNPNEGNPQREGDTDTEMSPWNSNEDIEYEGTKNSNSQDTSTR